MSSKQPDVWPESLPDRDALDALFGGLFGEEGVAYRIRPQAQEGGREAQKAAGQRMLAELRAELGGEKVVPSRSHSGPAILVLAVRPELAGEGVGIDLEPQGREISVPALKRILAAGEAGLPIPPIALWTIKEACYKAHPENAGTVLPQYRVTAFLPGRGPGEAAEGFARHERQGEPSMFFEFRVIETRGWTVCVARAALPGGPGPGVS